MTCLNRVRALFFISPSGRATDPGALELFYSLTCYLKTLLAYFQQVSGERPPLREQRAQVDVTRQREVRVSANRGPCGLAREFHKMLLQGRLDVRQRPRIPEGPQALLREVAQEVPDIQGRVALAVEVEVYEVDAVFAHDHLVRVEVPVDAARFQLRCPGAEPIARLQHPPDAPLPPWLPAGHFRQPILQDAYLVGHRVTAFGRHACPVDFVRCLRDSTRERLTVRPRYEIRRRPARHFALKPHSELRDRAHRLRHADAVRGFRLEAGLPERLQDPVAGLAESPHPDLADQGDLLRRRVRALDDEVVLDHTPPPRLVSRHPNLTQVQAAVLPGQPPQPVIELPLRLVWFEGRRDGRHLLVAGGAERVRHGDDRRPLYPSVPRVASRAEMRDRARVLARSALWSQV